MSSGNNSDIRIIRRTEASKFLADNEFEDLLDAIIYNNYPEAASNDDVFKKIKNKWLYDTSTYNAIEREIHVYKNEKEKKENGF